MEAFLAQLALQFSKSAPLFALIAAGFALSKWGGFSREASAALTKFAFHVAVTAMLFRLMAKVGERPPNADPQLLAAFFGACLATFVVARAVAAKCFRLDAVGGSVFGTGCIFSNNSFLGLPLGVAMLGEAVVPAIAMVISVNALALWTLALVSVELGKRAGHLTWRTFLQALLSVLKNPIVVAVVSGAVFGASGLRMPYLIDEPLRLLGVSATPLSLVVVGMGLAEYGIGRGLDIGITISVAKLFVQPAVIFCLARLLGLGSVETTAVVFLGAMPCGVSVYLMARQFHGIEEATANAMLVSTLAAAATVPVVVTLLAHFGV